MQCVHRCRFLIGRLYVKASFLQTAIIIIYVGIPAGELAQTHWVNGPELIEGEVQPAEVGGVVHKQSTQGLAELVPETQSVVVEEESSAGGGCDVEVYSFC